MEILINRKSICIQFYRLFTLYFPTLIIGINWHTFSSTTPPPPLLTRSLFHLTPPGFPLEFEISLNVE